LKEEEAMRILNMAIVILVPSLLFSVGTKAWSASPDQAGPSNAQVAQANTASHDADYLLNMLWPVATDSKPNDAKQNCGPSHMYSQHDVVGEAEGCVGHGASFGPFFAPATAP
jgi:hypothetical protein